MLFIWINLIGVIAGLITYSKSMAATSPWLWIMLVDCPLYPVLMVFILAFRKNKLVQKFSFLAFYGLIKYGLWTIVAWTLYYKQFLMISVMLGFINGIILLGHFGMILESGFVARRASKSGWLEVLLPIAWMLTNDLFDYGFGTHPPLPDDRYLGLLLMQNLALNILIPVFLFILARRSLDRN
jgi:uncharacterized membrane protein YpjA